MPVTLDVFLVQQVPCSDPYARLCGSNGVCAFSDTALIGSETKMFVQRIALALPQTPPTSLQWEVTPCLLLKQI
jgi:hypothetical protein